MKLIAHLSSYGPSSGFDVEVTCISEFENWADTREQRIAQYRRALSVAKDHIERKLKLSDADILKQGIPE
jgi:hypothetical protein